MAPVKKIEVVTKDLIKDRYSRKTLGRWKLPANLCLVVQQKKNVTVTIFIRIKSRRNQCFNLNDWTMDLKY